MESKDGQITKGLRIQIMLYTWKVLGQESDGSKKYVSATKS